MRPAAGIIAVCTIALSNNPSDMLIKLPTYVTNLIHCGRVTGQGYDYCDLLDEMLVLSRREDLDRYRKRLKFYSRIQILFIDDFAISRYSEDGIKILYHLIKTRTDIGTSTMFTSQYAPSEWGRHLSDEEGCYGKLDGIRRRLTTGYTVHIEKLR